MVWQPWSIYRRVSFSGSGVRLCTSMYFSKNKTKIQGNARAEEYDPRDQHEICGVWAGKVSACTVLMYLRVSGTIMMFSQGTVDVVMACSQWLEGHLRYIMFIPTPRPGNQTQAC